MPVASLVAFLGGSVAVSSYGLPVNVDSTYADSTLDPGVKAHQQHHDKIHTVVNWFDKDAPKDDGDTLIWDAATQLFVPQTPAGGGGTVTQTTYTTAAPGTVFRLNWNGASWPSTRPSSRTDIFFELWGAPVGNAEPTWKISGDGAVYSRAQVDALISALTTRVTALEQGTGTSGSWMPANTTIEQLGGVRNRGGAANLWGRTAAEGDPPANLSAEGDLAAIEQP